IEGRGPYDFLVDTGTNSTVVDEELAAELHLRPVDRIQLVSITGAQIVPRAFVESLTLGSRRAPDLEVLVEPSKELHALDSRIRGVVGQNFLSHFNYLIDYRHRQITFEGPSNPELKLRGIRVPFTSSEGRMLITVKLSSIGSPRRMVLDTGISSPVFFTRLRSAFPQPGTTMSLNDLASHTPAGVQGTSEIKIADQQIVSLPVVLVAVLSPDRSEDGLMPAVPFNSIYVDNRQNSIILNPKM